MRLRVRLKARTRKSNSRPALAEFKGTKKRMGVQFWTPIFLRFDCQKILLSEGSARGSNKSRLIIKHSES
jgi:hypothetical protein